MSKFHLYVLSFRHKARVCRTDRRTERETDGRTDRQTDRQNYDPQDRAIIAASRSKNENSVIVRHISCNIPVSCGKEIEPTVDILMSYDMSEL